MPRLLYIDEHLARGLVARLTNEMFPEAPAFHLRGRDGEALLDSALARPQWSYYRTLPTKAAVLHHALNLNHPFVDGNKRFAFTAMETFLVMNRAALLATDAETTDFALGVADGKISQEEAIAFVKRRSIRVQWSESMVDRWKKRLTEDDWDHMPQAARELRSGRFPTALAALREELRRRRG